MVIILMGSSIMYGHTMAQHRLKIHQHSHIIIRKKGLIFSEL